MNATDKLKSMVGKTYEYKGNTVMVVGYKTLIGTKKEGVEINFGSGEKNTNYLWRTCINA